MTGVDDRLDEPSNEAVEADLMIACAYDPNDAWGEYSSDAMIAAWRAGYQNAQGRLRDAQAENERLRAELHSSDAWFGSWACGCTDTERTVGGIPEFCPEHGEHLVSDDTGRTKVQLNHSGVSGYGFRPAEQPGADGARATRAALQPYTYPGTVESVYDGDTLHVTVDLGFGIRRSGTETTKTGITIRLTGCNAAELGTPGGDAAAANLQALLPAGTPVVLRTISKDKFDRWDADIELADGTDLIQLLIDGQWVAAWNGEGERPWPRTVTP